MDIKLFQEQVKLATSNIDVIMPKARFGLNSLKLSKTVNKILDDNTGLTNVSDRLDLHKYIGETLFNLAEIANAFDIDLSYIARSEIAKRKMETKDETGSSLHH